MNSTLSDHHGVWCAWCLNYITPPETKEEHHAYPKWSSDPRPAFSAVLSDWWHRYGSLFGSAWAEYRCIRRPKPTILGRLQAAQFILCCLGLRGPPTPDLRQPGHPMVAGLQPSDIVGWIAQMHPGH